MPPRIRGKQNTLTTTREKLHLYCASARYAFVFHPSPGNNHDAPEGRKSIKTIRSNDAHNLLMDRAYKDDRMRALAKEQGSHVVVPPKKNLGITIKNFTNSEMKQNVIFFG